MAKRKKVYYPEGQIQKGLYTNGGEWMLEDGTEYVGDYHRYSTGEVFTRGYYIRDVSDKLIPYIDLQNVSKKDTFQYDKLKSSEIDTISEVSFKKPQPTDADYGNGYFFRYFVKRHFQKIITEVDRDTFLNVPDNFYVKTQLVWKLRGPLNDTDSEKGVFDTNKRLVALSEKDVEGLTNYITDYIEYAIMS